MNGSDDTDVFSSEPLSDQVELSYMDDLPSIDNSSVDYDLFNNVVREGLWKSVKSFYVYACIRLKVIK